MSLRVLLINCLNAEHDTHACELTRSRFQTWLDTKDVCVWFGANAASFALELKNIDLVIVSGSATKADDVNTPWVDSLISWLHRLLSMLEQREDVRVLGICFGSQVLATACGGSCLRLLEPEVGGVSCKWGLPDEERSFRLVAAHGETVQIAKEGMRVLAENKAGGIQGFVAARGKALGVTCHPEYGRLEGEVRANQRREREEISDLQLSAALESLALPLDGGLFARDVVLPWVKRKLLLE